ncbi:MAG TPA: tlde1 domain-containing protein [Limnobacter sp.]|nr:tlde1 domain-containing protein [Limnobacter sp.]
MKSVMSLHFDGSVLTIRTASGLLKTYNAVSGKPLNKKFDYSAERQTAANQGPIPEGHYWINPSEMWENNLIKSALRSPRSAWGDYRLTIRVSPGTKTHGRGGFFIHGGDMPGSAGCIDLTHAMNRFVKDLRDLLGPSLNCHVPLTVEYGDAK